MECRENESNGEQPLRIENNKQTINKYFHILCISFSYVASTLHRNIGLTKLRILNKQ